MGLPTGRHGDEDGRRSMRRVAATWGAALAMSMAALGCAGGPKAPTPSPPARSRASAPVATKDAIDPLLRANGDFHSEYAAARALAQATLGASRPYFFLGEGKLVLHIRGKTEERSLSSVRFDALKHASHVPVAALSAVLAKRDEKALRALAGRMREVDPAITPALFGDSEQAAHAVVRASVELLEAASATELSDADLYAFGRRTRSQTTQLLQGGCDALLVHLDAVVRQLRPLVGDAWPLAVVVIATDHQSRAEEVGTQYFEHLFHEQAKEGALGESRIVILESIGPNENAMQAMASHLYDQRLSVLLFGDPGFLQGDVLGKHAEPTIARLLATPF
jgi:hypothetical protein